VKVKSREGIQSATLYGCVREKKDRYLEEIITNLNYAVLFYFIFKIGRCGKYTVLATNNF
jgi:hypothetical protein